MVVWAHFKVKHMNKLNFFSNKQEWNSMCDYVFMQLGFSAFKFDLLNSQKKLNIKMLIIMKQIEQSLIRIKLYLIQKILRSLFDLILFRLHIIFIHSKVKKHEIIITKDKIANLIIQRHLEVQKRINLEN
ncbi:unnamed protein product [Paramecium sonneborni]|uniref:Uncharacterized protein n=1 Tax=Paramecium sonneborni TaxID=65129 RepID=A0A8S1M4E6_9CILI|nr:unnamed protein product [Paramecium sonneborni]